MEWQAVGAVVGVILASWGGLVLWAVKALLDRQAKHIDTRFDELAAERSKDAERVSKLEHELQEARSEQERKLLELRVELPTHYVRREDAIRQETVFHHKLDALAKKLDEVIKGMSQ